MLKNHLGLLMLSLVLTIASCGPVPWQRLDLAKGEFDWADKSSPRSVMPGQESNEARSTVKAYSTDSSLDATLAYYETIGNLVGTYTPQSVRLYLADMLVDAKQDIGMGMSWVSLGRDPYPRTEADLTNGYMDQFYADFTNPDLVFEAGEGLPTGTRFPVLAIRFETMSADHGYGDFDGNYITIPEVVVDLPGYEGVFARGSQPIYLDRSVGSVLSFKPFTLVPGNFGHYPEKGEGLISGSQFIFLFNGNSYGLTDAADHSEYYNDAWGSLLLPFEPLLVGPGARKVRFHVRWDVDNLVHIYDRNTPDDKYDDVAVFAPRFWERIHVTVEVF